MSTSVSISVDRLQIALRLRSVFQSFLKTTEDTLPKAPPMFSPFEQYFGTNHVPSADDVVEIKKLLEDSDKEVQSTDAEITQLQQQLHILQVKKSRIQEYAEQHRALMSPARRLSRDILEEIFLTCLPTDQNPCMSVTEAPMLLTQICSLWRTISHSTPRLWAAIHIVVPSGSIDQLIALHSADYLSMQERLVKPELEKRKTAAKDWLDRSGACPLSISVYQCPIYTSTWHIDSREYLLTMDKLRLSFITSIILPYHEHWSSLDLFLSKNMMQNLLDTGITAQSLKHLKGFHITYQSTTYPQFDPLEERDITNLLPSHLTSLTLTSHTGYRQMISSPNSKYFWEQLTELNWTIMSIDSVGVTLDIISHCRALKSLKLQMHAHDNGNTSERNAGSIDLSYLTSLSLSVIPTTEFTDFVKHLNLPSLRTLRYEVREDVRSVNSQMIPEPLSILIRSCGDTLQVLQLYGSYIPGSRDLIDLLQFTPHLKDLKLFTERIDHSRYVQTLIQDYPYTTCGRQDIGDELLYTLSLLCPQLEILEFSRGMLTRITERGLKEYVKARNRARLNDPQIPALRKICMPINAWKRKETDGPETTEEKVLLGPDSAVYFQKRKTYRPESTLFPYHDVKIDPRNYSDDIHTEL